MDLLRRCSIIVGVVVVMFMTVGKFAECLKCVQCSSIFDRMCIGGEIAPENCSINDTYCVTYEGIVKSNTKVVFRDCSEFDRKSECSMKRIDNNPVKVCYSTCQTDGCNHASLTPACMHVLELLVVAFFTICLVRGAV